MNSIRHSLTAGFIFLSTLLLGITAAQADDTDIYVNSIVPTPQAPLTVIGLDLNLIDPQTVLCRNVLLPQPAPPAVPDPQDVGCRQLQEAVTVTNLLAIVNTLPGNLGGAINTTLVAVALLVPDLLNQTVAAVMDTGAVGQGLFAALNNTLVAVGAGNLPEVLTSSLPLFLALSDLLQNFVDTRVAIMLNHGNAGPAGAGTPPGPAGACAFADQASVPGQRQDTPACSNGAYFFLGLLDPTRIDEVLFRLVPIVLGTLSTVTTLDGTGSLSLNSLDPTPYQTKEMYAELMHYLTGAASFNAKLNVNDNALSKALVRDESIETADNRAYQAALQQYPQACTINFLHIQLTQAMLQDDSDDRLLALLPELRRPTDAQGNPQAVSLADVVLGASDDGFVYNNSRRYINSYFLVQDAIGNLGDLSNLSNLGGNVTTYTNVLGLVGRGKDVASATKRVLKTDSSLVSASVTYVGDGPGGLGEGVYIAQFQPDDRQRPVWPGNVKRLAIDPEDDVLVFQAVNGPGISVTDGRIERSALTFWTDPNSLGNVQVDGRETTLGGSGQFIPGHEFGGGGNPGRANPATPVNTARTIFYDSYDGQTAELAALNPDEAAVRDELRTATGATAFAAQANACSTQCTTTAAICSATCGINQTACNLGCGDLQGTCSAACSATQTTCGTTCGTVLATCSAAAQVSQTACKTEATLQQTTCQTLVATEQVSCIALPTTTRTACITLAGTEQTVCTTAAAAERLVCRAAPPCLDGIGNCTACEDDFNNNINNCTNNFNNDTNTCTNNFNNAVAPCNEAFNDGSALCTAEFNAANNACDNNYNGALDTCNADNAACNNTCDATNDSCENTCGTDGNQCTADCADDANSCNNACKNDEADCMTECGVGANRTVDTVTRELLLHARGFNVGTHASPTGNGPRSSPTDSGVTSRAWMLGGVIHSKPVAINYGRRNGAAVNDIRVVYGAADGQLHMARDADGSEAWAFMPQAVMRDLPRARENTAGSPLIYGVDGAPVVLIRDRPSDEGTLGVIGDSDDDRAIVFFGLRRGGAAYYALDVTDPDAPTLRWSIQRDGLRNNLTDGVVAGTAAAFEDLALAFSTPQIGRMRVQGADGNAATVPVLIFGGGYNGGRDALNNRVGKDLNNSRNILPTDQVGQDDATGNALFIVHAETGELIWRAENRPAAAVAFDTATRSYGHPLLQDGIASEVTSLDTNADGLIDRLYVGDTGGRIWRADFATVNPASWTLTPIASVGRHAATTPSTENDRRFFHAPDYVPIRQGGNTFDIVLLASGDRENPLDALADNRLYAIRDTDTQSGKAAADILTREEDVPNETDFVNNTALCANENNSCNSITNLATDRLGWLLELDEAGEKSFSSPLTIGGVILMTTYVPPDFSITADPCTPTEGTGRIYAINLADSSPNTKIFVRQTTRKVNTVAPGLTGDVLAIRRGAGVANSEIINFPGSLPRVISWRERLGEEERKQ